MPKAKSAMTRRPVVRPVAVVTGLHAQTLHIGPKLAAGVPAVKVADRNLALALKSGNFGAKDFFTTALKDMEVST